MDTDYPCKCGHKKEKHSAQADYCFPCFEEKINDMVGLKDTSWVHNFIPDNLKYLEEKYNKQILDKYRNK